MVNISIITPIKNGSKLFESTYKSVINQDYKFFEWIIIDDCSSEYEFNKIKNIIKDKRVKFIKSNNPNGPGPSRNIGLNLAKGEYITFIDSDDLWNKNFLSTSINFLESKKYDFVFSGYKRYVMDTKKYLSDFIPRNQVTQNSILRGSDISCLTAVLKREFLDQSTLFGDIPSRNDLVFFYSITKKTIAMPISEVLATYRIRNQSVSSNKLKALKYQFIVNYKIANNSFFLSSMNVIRWVIYGFFKYGK